MEKRILIDYLGYFLNNTTITEEEPMLSLLNRIKFDLGSVTVEVLKKNTFEKMEEKLQKTSLAKNDGTHPVLNFNVTRLRNDAKRNDLLLKFISRNDPYEIAYDLAKKLYLDTPSRILFNNLILEDVNNLIVAIDYVKEKGEDFGIKDSDNTTPYIDFLLDKGDLESAIDKEYLEAYKTQIYNRKSTWQDYEKTEDHFDTINMVTAIWDTDDTRYKHLSEETKFFNRESMKIQGKIRFVINSYLKDGSSKTDLEIMRDATPLEKVYLNTLFGKELELHNKYLEYMSDEQKESYRKGLRGEVDDIKVEIGNEE